MVSGRIAVVSAGAGLERSESGNLLNAFPVPSSNNVWIVPDQPLANFHLLSRSAICSTVPPASWILSTTAAATAPYLALEPVANRPGGAVERLGDLLLSASGFPHPLGLRGLGVCL